MLVGGIVLVIVLVAVMYFVGIPPIGENATAEASKAACHDEFGSEYRYDGYIEGNPPLLGCQSGGERAYMDMPQEIAQMHDYRATAYENGSEV